MLSHGESRRAVLLLIILALSIFGLSLFVGPVSSVDGDIDRTVSDLSTGAPESWPDSPDEEVTITEGESLTFVVGAEHDDGDLHGTEWYVDNSFEDATYGLSGSWGTDDWSRTFDEPGTYTVEANVFDLDEDYNDEAAEWTVTVEEEEDTVPESWPDSPDEEVTITEGESLTFVVGAEHDDSDLHGAEWYVDNSFEEATYGLSGSWDTDDWSRTFDDPGTYTVEADVFDWDEDYNDDAAEWTVIVEEEEDTVPESWPDSPDEEVTITEGESLTFVVGAEHDDGDLHGAEWYVDNSFEEATHGLSGSWDTDDWSRTFDDPGTYTVEADVFDWDDDYNDEAAEWTVTVEEEEDAEPESWPDSPDKDVTITERESITFVVSAEHDDGDLHGTEWYVDNSFEDATYGLSGSWDTDDWSRTFNEPGTYTVEADVFDLDEDYNDEAAEWTVTVEEEEDTVPESWPDSPDEEVTITEGESLTFVVGAEHDDGDLHGTEWYIDNSFEEATHGLSGSWDTDDWSRTFDEPGTYTVEADVFDWREDYNDEAAEWTVTVEKEEETAVPESWPDSPDEEVTITEGESITFVVGAEHDDGDIHATEWYVNDAHEENTYELSGSWDTDDWSRTFDDPGTYTVEANVFDSDENYNNESAEWTVTVEEELENYVNIVDISSGQEEYEIGEEVETTVIIENAGDERHTFVVDYTMASSEGDQYSDEDSEVYVTVDPDEAETVNLGWTINDDAPPGVYDIETRIWEESGQAGTSLSQTWERDAFVVSEGSDQHELVVSVVDQYGTPVEGVPVNLLGPFGDTIDTDPEGEVVFSVPESGDYPISIFDEQVTEPVHESVSVEDELVEHEVTVTRTEEAWIGGTVLRDDGEPASDVTVTIETRDGVYEATTDSDGEFEFSEPVVAGRTYDIRYTVDDEVYVWNHITPDPSDNHYSAEIPSYAFEPDFDESLQDWRDSDNLGELWDSLDSGLSSIRSGLFDRSEAMTRWQHTPAPPGVDYGEFEFDADACERSIQTGETMAYECQQQQQLAETYSNTQMLGMINGFAVGMQDAVEGVRGLPSALKTFGYYAYVFATTSTVELAWEVYQASLFFLENPDLFAELRETVPEHVEDKQRAHNPFPEDTQAHSAYRNGWWSGYFAFQGAASIGTGSAGKVLTESDQIESVFDSLSEVRHLRDRDTAREDTRTRTAQAGSFSTPIGTQIRITDEVLDKHNNNWDHAVLSYDGQGVSQATYAETIRRIGSNPDAVWRKGESNEHIFLKEITLDGPQGETGTYWAFMVTQNERVQTAYVPTSRDDVSGPGFYSEQNVQNKIQENHAAGFDVNPVYGEHPFRESHNQQLGWTTDARNLMAGTPS